MATTRKSSTKKTAVKKAAVRKAAVKKVPVKAAKINISGPIPKLTLSMPLDEKKIAAIHRCIQKGSLKVTLNRVDLVSGKLGSGWLYD
ncbi:hypothetical protein [Dyella tabacisoli]|nr:hypothetical protein [Dyella tabacisoli]